MKKNIYIILLLTLFFINVNETRALQENEYYLFKEFKHNNKTIPNFIINTNLCYLKTYYSKNDTSNYYYYWKPKQDNKEEQYIIVYNKIMNKYELYIKMKNYEYYDYGYQTRSYDFNLNLIFEEDTNKTYWMNDKTNQTLSTINHPNHMVVKFELIEDNWIQDTTIANNDNNTYTIWNNIAGPGTGIKNLLLGTSATITNEYEVIKSTYKIYDKNRELINYENYTNEEITNDYQIEDTTIEKENINENEIKLNEKMTKLIRTNLVQISKNESLYKLILITFITTLILIIKNKI